MMMQDDTDDSALPQTFHAQIAHKQECQGMRMML